MRFLAPIIAVHLALAISGCGGGDSPSGSAASAGSTGATIAESAAASPSGSNSAAKAPRVVVPKGPPPKKLVVKVLHEGSGKAIEKADDRIVVNYVGVDYETGKEFYDTWDRGGPSKALLREVHTGWKRGLKGMRVGGRRELIVPPRLAYGTDTLIYVIELVAVNPSMNSRQRKSAPSKPEVRVPSAPPPGRLVVKDLRTGSGPALEAGDEMAVHYVGVTYKTGKEFESTWGSGRPSTFPFGSGELIEGWERGLKGMRVGGRRELIVPSRLAYKTGALIFVVDLLAVKQADQEPK